MPPRLYSLDAARGIAALFVVISHWKHFFFSSPDVLPGNFNEHALPFYPLLSPIYRHGGTAVSFFFMLSGFVFFWLYKDKIARDACSWTGFALARFSRLYPLHFLTLLLVCTLQAIHFKVHSDYFVYQYNDSFHFALQLLLIPHWGLQKGYSFNAPIWSVSIEVGLYVVFFIMAVTRKSNWPHILGLMLVIRLVRLMGLPPGQWLNPLEIFLLGGLTFHAIHYYIGSSWRRKSFDYIFITTPILIWVLMAFSNELSNVVIKRPGLAIRFLFSTTIIALVLMETLVAAPFKNLKWLGDCSYSSYLLHFPLQIILVLLIPQKSAVLFSAPWFFCAFFLFLIGISIMSHRYFEIPLQNRIRGGDFQISKLFRTQKENSPT